MVTLELKGKKGIRNLIIISLKFKLFRSIVFVKVFQKIKSRRKKVITYLGFGIRVSVIKTV